MNATRWSFRNSAALAALLAMIAGGTHAQTPPIIYHDFSSVDGLLLNGSAAQAGAALRLTPSAGNLAGSAWHVVRQPVGDGFHTEFSFRIAPAGADGFAFVVQSHGENALGTIGGGIGYSGFPILIAVEFDTYMNAVASDPNGNHVSVHTCDPQNNNGNHSNSLGVATSIPLLSDGAVHLVGIDYCATSDLFTVYLDDPDTPRIAVSLGPAADALRSAGTAWVGFTAATGGGAEAHDILDWYFACSPAPTRLYVPDRTGIISEPVLLRAYLRRATDFAWLPGRAIEFGVDGSYVGSTSTDSNGRASLSWAISDGDNSRAIVAEFGGEPAYQASSGGATLTCETWTTKMASFDRTVRLSDRTELKCRLVRGDNMPLYGKPISFYVDGTLVVTRLTDTQGYAKWPVYDVPDGAGAGTRTILSEWIGNGGYAAISKEATLTVLRALPYIWVLAKSVPAGGTANLYAYFRRLDDLQKQAGKDVVFSIDGTAVGTVTTDPSAVARYLYHTTEPPGVYTIRCEFPGDAWIEAGYGEATLTIY